MRKIIEGEAVAAWVAGKIGRKFSAPYAAIGIEADGSILAGVVFNLWTGPNVHITGAGSPRAWSRAFLRRLAVYGFEELGCVRATFTTENPDAVNFCRRLGAQQEGTMRNAYGPGRDGLIFGLLKEDWRI
jgi:RimJ/RimL family protein N-acetyltransferase